MKSTILLLCVGVCLLAVMGTAAEIDQGKVEQGAVLYKEYCASCHGLDGKGYGPAAPAMSSSSRVWRCRTSRRSTTSAWRR